VLEDEALTQRGMELVRRLLATAVDEDGGVMHLLGDEASADVRLVEDAAALALAAVCAHEVAGDPELLAAARHILGHAESLFSERGVWYMTPAETELPLRPRERHDSPTPMGASLASLAAIRIWRATGKTTYRQTADAALQRAVPLAERSAFSAGTALEAMCELLGEQ
jgi:hypothetical protein